MPIKTMAEAIRDAQAELLETDARVFIMGEGVPDPKCIFGTTANLAKEFPGRVFDMPISENGGVGICIGAAITGMRPIFITQRADFLLYAADQIINNAAKWWGMFGGEAGACPLVIRAIIGRGWGQGMQHSQHLENLFGRIPGLRVRCPSNAYDAKGMLFDAVRGQTPTIIFEHRWTHELKCAVPDGLYRVVPGVKRLRGGHVTLRAWGYMVHVCLKFSDLCLEQGVRIAVEDTGGPVNDSLHGIVIRENDCCPPSPHLSRGFYPTMESIAHSFNYEALRLNLEPLREYDSSHAHDVPNPEFRGPF